MAFSLFGKKPPGKGKPEPTSPAPAKSVGEQAVPALPGKLSGGVAGEFRGTSEAPGRFAKRVAGRTSEGGSSIGYHYGAEVAGNSVATISGAASKRPASPYGVNGASRGGPLTEAAFTALPSHLDMNTAPRRRGFGAMEQKPEALDDCALSFANGQDADALRRIEDAIAKEALGNWEVQAWLMRFDLYEHLGLRAAFETQAMAFATRFERSPPVWPSEARSAEDTGGGEVIPTVNITGVLNAASAAPLSALRKTVDRYGGVRLDFARLQGADREGTRFLLVTIQALKRAGKMVKVGGEQQLVQQLRPRITPGDRSGDATSWLLYLELLQIVGGQDEFERVAIDYATTFEVSPPSWQRSAQKVVTASAPQPTDDRYYVIGDVVAPADRIFAEIDAHAARHPMLVLDMSRCRRIDFVSCSQLSSVLGKVQTGGKVVEIRSPNEMVSTLLSMMGADEVARIVPRRT